MSLNTLSERQAIFVDYNDLKSLDEIPGLIKLGMAFINKQPPEVKEGDVKFVIEDYDDYKKNQIDDADMYYRLRDAMISPEYGLVAIEAAIPKKKMAAARRVNLASLEKKILILKAAIIGGNKAILRDEASRDRTIEKIDKLGVPRNDEEQGAIDRAMAAIEALNADIEKSKKAFESNKKKYVEQSAILKQLRAEKGKKPTPKDPKPKRGPPPGKGPLPKMKQTPAVIKELEQLELIDTPFIKNPKKTADALERAYIEGGPRPQHITLKEDEMLNAILKILKDGDHKQLHANLKKYIIKLYGKPTPAAAIIAAPAKEQAAAVAAIIEQAKPATKKEIMKEIAAEVVTAPMAPAAIVEAIKDLPPSTQQKIISQIKPDEQPPAPNPILDKPRIKIAGKYEKLYDTLTAIVEQHKTINNKLLIEDLVIGYNKLVDELEVIRLHFRHNNIINKHLRQLQNEFKPMTTVELKSVILCKYKALRAEIKHIINGIKQRSKEMNITQGYEVYEDAPTATPMKAAPTIQTLERAVTLPVEAAELTPPKQKEETIDDLVKQIYKSEGIDPAKLNKKKKHKKSKKPKTAPKEEPAEEKEREVKEPPPVIDISEIEKCQGPIIDLTNMLYSTRKLKGMTMDKLMAKLRDIKDLKSIVESGDFYPTPPKVGQYIYEDVMAHESQATRIVDIAAGLGALSLPLILQKPPNVEQIELIEKDPRFSSTLQCFENATDYVKVTNSDFLDMEFRLPSNSRAVVLCNPPFRGAYNGERYNKFWLLFIVKILYGMDRGNWFDNAVYFICPGDKKNFYVGTDRPIKPGEQVIFEVEGNEYKKIKKALNISEDDAEAMGEHGAALFSTDKCFYMGKITGFKGLTKAGKPRNSADSALYKFTMGTFNEYKD